MYIPIVVHIYTREIDRIKQVCVCMCVICEGDVCVICEGDVCVICEGDVCVICEGDVCVIHMTWCVFVLHYVPYL